MKVPYALPTDRPYSGDQVKKLFLAAGVPISTWAEANSYTRHKVYLVINGQLRGNWGAAHEIAVKLGMKLAVSLPLDPAPPSERRSGSDRSDDPARHPRGRRAADRASLPA